MNNIVRLQRAQIEPAIAVLSRAFADDPLLSYFLPETEKARAKAIGQFYQTVMYYSHLKLSK